MKNMTHTAALLADAVRSELRQHADPLYVPGTTLARKPCKTVLGVRIPLLRAGVRAALRTVAPLLSSAGSNVIQKSAEDLWHGDVHEDELAACMLLRLSETPISLTMIRRWSRTLDNWLSADELGGLVGSSLSSGHLLVTDLEFLASSSSPWQRRLYIVSLIRPIRLGQDPGGISALPEVLRDSSRPVRKAAIWLVTSTIKARPSAAAQFRMILPGEEPKPLVRLIKNQTGT